ncbi:MAG: terminase small subunit [Bacilli bacterium]
MANLTEKQKAFCEEYAANGCNGIKAYKKIYNCGEKSAQDNASRLIGIDRVSEYIQELRAEIKDEAILTSIQRQVILSNMVRDNKDTKIADKIRAIDLLNKMDGQYIEKKAISIDTDWFLENPFDGLTTEELRNVIKNGKINENDI